MDIPLRRKTAGGATLVELTIVLVILGFLALTQLQSGLNTVDRVRKSIAGSHAATPYVVKSAHPLNANVHRYPTAHENALRQSQYSPNTDKTTFMEIRRKMAGTLHQAAEWLEPSSEQRHQNDSGRKVCVGSFCV